MDEPTIVPKGTESFVEVVASDSTPWVVLMPGLSRAPSLTDSSRGNKSHQTSMALLVDGLGGH